MSGPASDASATPRRGGRALRWALWGLAAVAVAAWGVRFCALGNDFLAFRDVGLQALRRGDPYAPSPTNGMYVFYAPHFGLLMAPFAALPRFAAGFLWFALKVAALAWAVREGWREIRATAEGLPRPRLWPAHLALPLLVAVNPIVGELKLGQVNLLVFVLTLLTVRAVEAGRPWRAALLFSVALVKVTPWVFVPWFAIRRQWRLLGAMAVVGAGWLAALSAWFGPERVVGIFRDWMVTSRTQKLGLEAVAYFENQSLQGVSARLATVWPPLLEPVLGVPLHRLAWVPVAALLLAVLVAAAWRDRFRAALPRAELAFVCLAMYLCSPDSRWAHQMQLLAPFALLGALAARVDLFAPGGGRAPRTWRRAVAAVVSLGLLFQVVLTRDVVGKRLDNASRFWSTHFLFVIALAALVAAVVLLRRPRGAEAGPDPLGVRAAVPLADASAPARQVAPEIGSA